jgi:HAD superfamily hydrolase (TIGR01509 family)
MSTSSAIRPRPELITFDLGNVLSLVDELPAAREFARLSGASEERTFRTCFAPEVKSVLETGMVTFPEFAGRAMSELGLKIPLERFIEVFGWSLTPNRGIFDLVDRIASRYRVALCSNTSEPHWELERRRLPFGHRFDPAVLSYVVGAMKPDRRIYDALSRLSGIPHEQIVFIDDVPANVEGARLTGIHAIQFTGVPQLEADLAAAGVTLG